MIYEEDEYYAISQELKEYYQEEFQEKEKELQKYKNIEEELGIDLVTLFKAITYGFFYKHKYRNYPTTIEFADTYRKFIYREGADEKNAWCIGVDGMDEYMPIFYLKDYGKTWALTEEELE